LIQYPPPPPLVGIPSLPLEQQLLVL
jgi:hypothetical protein